MLNNCTSYKTSIFVIFVIFEYGLALPIYIRYDTPIICFCFQRQFHMRHIISSVSKILISDSFTPSVEQFDVRVATHAQYCHHCFQVHDQRPGTLVCNHGNYLGAGDTLWAQIPNPKSLALYICFLGAAQDEVFSLGCLVVFICVFNVVMSICMYISV